jgi:DNA-directed RNA polymerase subunit RPC12/RpoP
MASQCTADRRRIGCPLIGIPETVRPDGLILTIRARQAAISMAIKFRCTRCRARLHVPTRWGGTSVACPKCSTRVVVPAGEKPVTRFEQADVERSLDSLEPAPGGIFATASFEVPLHGESEDVAMADEDGMTRPRWTVYAHVTLVTVVAVVSFFLGALWMSSGLSP